MRRSEDTLEPSDTTVEPGATSPQTAAAKILAGKLIPYEERRRNIDRSPVTRESRKAALELARSAQRRTATPIRKSFVRRDDGSKPPMAQLYQGGRSGTVALKVYLALIWKCSRPPYNTMLPARGLATLLNLDDPERRGARRVLDAMRALADLKLITITRTGGVNEVTLLDESGDGSAYRLPSTAYTRAPAGAAGEAQRARNRYFLLPNELWLAGDIQQLEGPGLVMLLILLAERAGEGAEVWFSTEAFPRRYSISAPTRSAGTKQLSRLHLLSLDRRPVSTTGTVFELKRRRNIYRLQGPALAPRQPEPTADHIRDPRPQGR